LLTGWFLGLVFCLAAFSRGLDVPSVSYKTVLEIRSVAGLLILLVPLYLIGVYQMPHRVNTDEIIFLMTADGLLQNPHPDLFGLTHYFGFPAGSFLVIGRMSQWLGGIGLEQVRWVNGFFGLCTVGAAYAYYRYLWAKREAWWAALLFGTSQALVGISRMAVRDNLPVFVEIVAMVLLIRGLARRSRASLLLGGFVAGLGVYNYYSARIIFIVWTIFLAFLWAVLPRPNRLKKLVLAWSTSALGFFLVAAPMAIASWKGRQELIGYPAGQFVFSQEGHHIVEMWEGMPFRKAYWSNLWKGLTVFNNGLSDRGNIYINPRHGFLDPVSGMFLWVGVAVWFFHRRRSLPQRLAASGLLVIWLFLSILTTKNPEYSRMLVVLPFAILFAFQGMQWVARKIAPQHSRMVLRTLVFLVALGNIYIYLDQTRQSHEVGDIPGETVRYVAQRSMLPSYTYYIVMDEEQPYFWFGKTAWQPWVKYFAGEQQNAFLITSAVLRQPGPWPDWERPFTLFMNGQTWAIANQRLMQSFPQGQIHPMAPQNLALAFEVLR